MILFSQPSVLLSFIPICVLFLFCIFSATPPVSFFSHESLLIVHLLLPPPQTAAASSPLTYHALFRLYWRIVSTHERAQWSDQLAIRSHKSIDLIPWRRDLHVPLHCSAPLPGLGGDQGLCLKLGCVCHRCKGIVCPKIHQFATQHFVNTGSGDVSKSAWLCWSFTEAKEFIHFQYSGRLLWLK